MRKYLSSAVHFLIDLEKGLLLKNGKCSLGTLFKNNIRHSFLRCVVSTLFSSLYISIFQEWLFITSS